MPTDTTDDGSEVELIDTSGLELSQQPTKEPLQRAPILGNKALVAISVGLILIGLVVIPRTGPPAVRERTPSQTTVSSAPTTSRRRPTTPVSQAIPLFGPGDPVDLPGVLSGIDSAGSLIVIDRTKPRPEEALLGMTLAPSDPKSTLILDRGGPILVEPELSAEGSQIVVTHRDGRFLEPSFDLEEIAPTLDGNVVVVSHRADTQTAVASPLSWDGIDRDSLLEWTLPGQGSDILGLWGDQLVVQRANNVWLVDTSLQSTLIGTGHLLSYDGTHLARLVCVDPVSCSIVVGTPEDPEITVLPLPAALAEMNPRDWVGSVTVSPDGAKLAASVRQGAVWRPLVVNLPTGETSGPVEGTNREASVAWSPDGEWVAYVFTDDVMVWNLALRRSWRLQINRELQTLLWR